MSALPLDIILACLFPISLAFIGFKLYPTTSLRDLIVPPRARKAGAFSLDAAHKSFEDYAHQARNELSAMRRSYATLGRSHKKIGYELGYPRKLDRMQESIQTNRTLTKSIAQLAREEYTDRLSIDPPTDVNLMRVREVLKHFVRDWSEEGKAERDIMFKPILDHLASRSGKVLVPGCGLGRLAWEISKLGFDTTANELSYFMILGMKLLLKSQVNQHTVCPYAHWLSHQRDRRSTFREIQFPDEAPRSSPTFKLAEQDFMMTPVPLGGYDFIVTLFFIDTSLNVLSTIEKIHTLLKPGGTWINCGPLLWTGGAQAKVELSLEEVLDLAEQLGFVFQHPERAVPVQCEYTADKQAMMRWLYEAQFWVATRQ